MNGPIFPVTSRISTTPGMPEPSAYGTNAYYVALANTLGHAVLVETLRMAAYYINHSNGTAHKNWHSIQRIREASSCYTYIQGTGLEYILQTYDLRYDADKLRKDFSWCVRKIIQR